MADNWNQHFMANNNLWRQWDLPRDWLPPAGGAPPVGGAPPPLLAGHQAKHLSVTGNREGICGRFRTKCPPTIEKLPGWVRKLRAAIANAKSGVMWSGSTQIIPGTPPERVHVAVPLVDVFDKARGEIKISVPHGPNLYYSTLLTPPQDVPDEMSEQVYNTALGFIDFDERHFYEGVPEILERAPWGSPGREA